MPTPSDWNIPIPASQGISTSRTNINNALDLLKTNFQGNADPHTSPSIADPGMIWIDTTNEASAGALIKIRNNDNQPSASPPYPQDWLSMVRMPKQNAAFGFTYYLSRDQLDSISGGSGQGDFAFQIGGEAAGFQVFKVARTSSSPLEHEVDFKGGTFKNPKFVSGSSSSGTTKFIEVDDAGTSRYIQLFNNTPT